MPPAPLVATTSSTMTSATANLSKSSTDLRRTSGSVAAAAETAEQVPLQLPSSADMSPQEMWSYLARSAYLFVFPEDVEFGPSATIPSSANVSCTRPRPLSHLTVYAKYGPGIRTPRTIFDETIRAQREATEVKLKGGLKRLLQHHEVKQMIDEEERSFICEIYGGGDGMPQASATSKAAPRSCTVGVADFSFAASTFRSLSQFSSRSLHSSPLLSGGVSVSQQRHESSCSSANNNNSASGRNVSLTKATTGIHSENPAAQNSTHPSPPPNTTSNTTALPGNTTYRHAAPPAAARSMVAPNTSAASLKDSVYGDLLNHRHPLVFSATSITKEEFQAIVDDTEYPVKEKDGKPVRWSTLADAMANAFLRERQRRIVALKTATPSVETIRGDPRVSNRAATFFLCRTHPKVRNIQRFEGPADVLVALHRYAFQVSDVALVDEKDGKTPIHIHGRGRPTAAELTNNVKCLRSDFVADRQRPGWDATSCLKGVNGTVSTHSQRVAVQFASTMPSRPTQLSPLPPLT